LHFFFPATGIQVEQELPVFGNTPFDAISQPLSANAMIHGFTELHQRRFYVTSVLFVSPILRLCSNLPENGMDEVCVNVFFVQRGPDCELDARNDVSLSLSRLRTGGCFFDLQVAPHPAVYRSVRNSSNGREIPSCF
jgi:hypothetical protein